MFTMNERYRKRKYIDIIKSSALQTLKQNIDEYLSFFNISEQIMLLEIYNHVCSYEILTQELRVIDRELCTVQIFLDTVMGNKQLIEHKNNLALRERLYNAKDETIRTISELLEIFEICAYKEFDNAYDKWICYIMGY